MKTLFASVTILLAILTGTSTLACTDGKISPELKEAIQELSLLSDDLDYFSYDGSWELSELPSGVKIKSLDFSELNEKEKKSIEDVEHYFSGNYGSYVGVRSEVSGVLTLEGEILAFSLDMRGDDGNGSPYLNSAVVDAQCGYIYETEWHYDG